MTLKQELDRDHHELESLGRTILQTGPGADIGGRDNQFDRYELQLRRHLALVEDVLFPPLRAEQRGQDVITGIEAAHKEIRSQLSALDRTDKGSPQWTREFSDFTIALRRLCERHHGLAQQAEREAGDKDLAREYREARRQRGGGGWNWNRIGLQVAGGLAGVAAVAGAAYAATLYYRSGSEEVSDDDFELRLETDENLRLISSSKVQGTPVVGRDGTALGRIEDFMVDKYTGRVAYAIMSFGGTMGFGKSLFPLPWPLLDYEEEKDGYVLDITREELKNAPRFEAETQPDWTPEFRSSVLFFYRPSEADRTETETGNSAAAGGGGTSPTPETQSAGSTSTTAA